MHPSFFAGLVGTFLPAGLRPAWLRDHLEDLRTPAILTGLVQMAACLVTLFLRYMPFVHSQFAAVNERAMSGAAEKSGETAVMGLGVVVLVAYILQPISLALFYFALEGAVRAIAAFIHNEPIGTLPLYLLLLLGRKAQKEAREYQLGPRVVDKVLPAPDGETGYDLVIASCRGKDWNPSLTIVYQEQLYELARSFEGDGPRKFVYLLRKAPRSKLVRGLHHYDPEEGVTAESVAK